MQYYALQATASSRTQYQTSTTSCLWYGSNGAPPPHPTPLHQSERCCLIWGCDEFGVVTSQMFILLCDLILLFLCQYMTFDLFFENAELNNLFNLVYNKKLQLSSI